ncbi:MAG: aminoglycoside phosphotransferase family protein [Anaerolineae bacterium]
MSDVIVSAEQATAGWLTSALQKAGVLEYGEVTSVVAKPQPGKASANLQVTYSEEMPESTPSRLFLKIASPALTHGVPGLGKKEVIFYNAIAPDMAYLPVVRCFDALYSDEQDRYHLLMEDLGDTHIALPPSQLPPPEAHCEMIVDALAQIHAYWWNDRRLGDEIGENPDEDHIRYFFEGDAASYADFADYLGDRLSPARRAVYEKVIADFLPVLTKRLTSGSHITLVFEDVHAGNFLYPRDPEKDRLRIIDWEQWAVNIGAHDLAYMMAMFWFPERRARLEQPLLKRYHERLLEGGVEKYTWDDCWYDYRLSVIGHLFTPVWQQQHAGERMTDVWWNHLERIFLAYEDLNCSELL